MDILELFSTFTEANGSQKSLELYLESADALQCFACENADALKHVLSYLKNNLIKSKSCPKGPLMVLQSVLGQCSTNVFAKNCLQWIDSLHKILKMNANDEVLRLSCDISIDLLFYLAQNPDLSREFSSVHLANLVTSLLVKNSKIQVNLLKTLRQCMKQFPGSCRQLRNDIEQFLLNLIASEDIHTIKEVAACLVLLPSLGGGGGGDQGSYNVKIWQELFQKILGSLHGIVCKILKRASLDESFWDLKENLTLNLPLIEDTVPILAFQKSFKMYCSLCFCLIEILSSSFPFPVAVPLDAVMGFSCTVLTISPNDLGVHKTTEDLMLLAILPSVQSVALDVFQVLIENCNRHLINYSGMIVKILLQLLDSTKIQKNWTGTIKPYSDIRIKVYKLIRTWTVIATSASGCERHADAVFSHILLDMKNVNSSSVMSKVNCLEPTAKKRKLHSNSEIESLGHKKNNPVLNSDLNKVAVEAFKYLMLAVGPVLNHSTYMNISAKIIQAIQDIHCKFFRLPSPYKDPEYRQQLYAALLTIVTIQPKESMPPMQVALGLFQIGLQDEDYRVKGFCLEAINTTTSMLHPRANHIRTCLPDPPRNFVDKNMDDDQMTASLESKQSQTSFDSIDVACSPIPSVQKESKNPKVLQTIAEDRHQGSASVDDITPSLPDEALELGESSELTQLERSTSDKKDDLSQDKDDISEDIEMEESVIVSNSSSQKLPVKAQDLTDKQEEDAEKILDMLESFVNADPD